MAHPWFNGIQWDALYSQPMDHFFVPRPTDELSTAYFLDRKGFKAANDSLFSFSSEPPNLRMRIEALNADIIRAAPINFKNYEYKNVDGLKNINTILVKHMLRERSQSTPTTTKNSPTTSKKKVLPKCPKPRVQKEKHPRQQ